MKSTALFVVALFALTVGLIRPLAAQISNQACTNNNQWIPYLPGQDTIELGNLGDSVHHACVHPGEYMLLKVCAGSNYTIHTCVGTRTFTDTRLTLYRDGDPPYVGNRALTWNDDACGSGGFRYQSVITWTATFNGAVQIVLDMNDFFNGLTGCFHDTTVCVGLSVIQNTSCFICRSPSELWTDRITPSSARLNWNRFVGAVNGYHLRGKNINSASWVSIHIPDDSITQKSVYGLNEGATYVWQIRSLCNPDPSQWSTLDTFTTGCYPPDSTWTSAITANAATLNWKANAGAAGYRIHGRVAGGNRISQTIVGQFNTSKSFPLQPGVTYEWYVRTLCSQTLASPPSDTLQFTTPNGLKRGDASLPFAKNNRQNPFEVMDDGNHLLLRWAEPLAASVEVRIYDIAGKTVRTISSQTVMKREIAINREGLGSGYYIVEAKGAEVWRGKVFLP